MAKTIQYCKVISLQVIYIDFRKSKKKKKTNLNSKEEAAIGQFGRKIPMKITKNITVGKGAFLLYRRQAITDLVWTRGPN